MVRLGIDIGGSGIKGALVDINSGELKSDRIRIATPQPACKANIAQTVKKLVSLFEYDGPIGVSFPVVVKNNIALQHGNLDPEWVGTNISELFSSITNKEFYVANDADLAGLAEMTLGIGKNLDGKVIMITIGTGLGSGFFYNRILIPNTELGRILGKDGQPIEYYASDRARKREDLSWSKWGKRFDFYLNHIVRTFTPDHIILGGGASKKWEKYSDKITCNTPIHIASFLNNAGIIGAAMYGEQQSS